MGNSKADIIVPRSALPDVSIIGAYISGPTISDAYASSVHAQAMRDSAYERLAIAERIDQFLAEQEDRKLLHEAAAFASKVDGAPHSAHSFNQAYWTKIARAAREVHGIK